MNYLVRSVVAVLLVGLPAQAAQTSRVGHHGGMILHCEPPHFFDAAPAKEAHLPSFQEFSLIASENTDGETVKAWVNNIPVPVSVSRPDHSGRLLIQGRLPQVLTQGRAWIRVSAESHEGCDDFSTWNVYVP